MLKLLKNILGAKPESSAVADRFSRIQIATCVLLRFSHRQMIEAKLKVLDDLAAGSQP